MLLSAATKIVNADLPIKSVSSHVLRKFSSLFNKKEPNQPMSLIKSHWSWISGSIKFQKQGKKYRICFSIGVYQVPKKSLFKLSRINTTNNSQEIISTKLHHKRLDIFQRKLNKDFSYKSKESNRIMTPKLNPLQSQ